ncbi:MULTISPECIES: type I restriction-modification system endonuclease [unclassified Fusibacter]|uniref:type I restriction-modification system endonuclease n=1 Tax=unclassified Fusibacter TaxID=2624464 RepID=UPI0010133ABA|nr:MULTISPECIES: type I restriction-modification system endonuclease [unclassified Fusibacter]MCK8059724.1 type I restriction-modification system endonuclease [Fusibacter sp. A2]NPE21525.1 type I restriction-modification system endonuclease [Fusibacter sp. A1]RXV61935.1 type I restriction-modification system endonuclease [Fusibacter sp. A1]
MKTNFIFLKEKWPTLATLGQLSEKNIYQDPNTSLIKLGMFGELLVDFMYAYDDLETPFENTQVNKLKVLKQNDLLPYEIDNILHTLRKSRNKAAHENYSVVNDAMVNNSLAYKLAVWFMKIYGDWQFEEVAYIEPVDQKDKDLTELLKAETKLLSDEYDLRVNALELELKRFRKEYDSTKVDERKEKSRKVASLIKLNEKETRKIIDEQLRMSGWEVDSSELTYSKGTRPDKRKNLAISEWPTDAVGSRTKGRADYALFVKEDFVGIIEAKRGSKDIPSDIQQAKQYAAAIKEEHSEYVINNWNDNKVPFIFATNGRKYLKQIEEKSGVWFLDVRKSTNHPKALQSWHSPEGLMNLLSSDIDDAHHKLKEEPYQYLQDPKGLGLRDYQIDAIKSVEASIEAGQESILISMATGTGKTRTTIGLVYRLIKSDRFRRVLFLVDRSSLGEQAEDAFKDSVIEDLQTFNRIYDVKVLGEKTPELTTKLHISTVQGMVRRILFSEDEVPAIDTYDCIVVDEAHRGYILDKEMGDVELEYRNQDDYISKYRAVIEYFDAVKIALTATPALHTTSIFGQPVYNYSYREAVIDGYLVDHEPPHQITTELSDNGISYKQGDVVPIYDPITNEIINSAEIPDDINIEVEQFNKKVINENFNRVVLDEITDYISPEGPDKTLIFAATDLHADMIVRLLKEIYEAKGYLIEDDSIMKITGSVTDPLEAIKRYKNEVNPVIAVTVDLLTTGIDVPRISNLVFMRRVRSRILYEQMLGRATRLCDDIGKTHFNIYDAVKLYEGLEKVTNMKPVVASASVSFEDLVAELNQLENETQKKRHIDAIVAKLQRKKRTLSGEHLELFKSYTGGLEPDEFIKTIRNGELSKAVDMLTNSKELLIFLDKKIYNPRQIIYSDHEDELTGHERGYGVAEKPEDYMHEFAKFIKENMNKIPALEIVCQRPQELTRASLKSLRLELTKHGFTEANLNTAHNSMKNEDIAADIISFIRQHALGDALVNHDDRIRNAMKKVKQLQQWKPNQFKWIERIEKQLLKEYIIDKESFGDAPFSNDGGYDRINKQLNNRLDEILVVLNENLYNNRETA